jgi:3-hydroxyacyl-[acyl-carrier-protein] dehydratase
MRFSLLDRVVQFEPGARLTAVKNLSLAEEYLADHFPRAPVMPGVLMLEALVQAAAWLVRASEDFAHSIVVLKAARGIKFANFVEPGQSLTIQVQLQSQDDRETRVKAQAEVLDHVAVSSRLVLERFNLGDGDPSAAAIDAFVVERLRNTWTLLYRCPAANHTTACDPRVDAAGSPQAE